MNTDKLIELLKEAQYVICRLKLSMLVHPDCTEGSEFDDYTSTAQEMEDKIESFLKNNDKCKLLGNE